MDICLLAVQACYPTPPISLPYPTYFVPPPPSPRPVANTVRASTLRDLNLRWP